MISKFKWASFPLKTAIDTNLEEQANIAYTESNVQQFLARLEENMAFLVQNIAKNKQKLSQQEAVLANLRLEELNKKTWEQPQSAVQYKEEINELPIIVKWDIIAALLTLLSKAVFENQLS